MAWLDSLTPTEAEEYIAEGQFAPGSILPKVQAASGLRLLQSGAHGPHHTVGKGQGRHRGTNRHIHFPVNTCLEVFAKGAR